MNSVIAKIEHSLIKVTNDDKLWHKRRRRLVITAILLGLFLQYHTLIVYSPKVLISALYHGREIGVPYMGQIEKQKRDKLLERMFQLYVAYHHGGPVNTEPKEFHVPKR